jgi:alkylation response protein AidB-like acyl-CoA dehydrogenase
MSCSARADGGDYVLDGEKTWISNGGIADFYVVFARTGEALGARGISAFIVEAGTPGFEIAERIHVIAPHPLARLRFTNCRVSEAQRVGAPGEGFKIAMRTLDVFRTSVAAAALGFARRALTEGLARATTRRMFGGMLSDFQLTQAKLAQMATTIDAAALLTYRAAWLRDQGGNVTKEAAMAKMVPQRGRSRSSTLRCRSGADSAWPRTFWSSASIARTVRCGSALLGRLSLDGLISRCTRGSARLASHKLRIQLLRRLVSVATRPES